MKKYKIECTLRDSSGHVLERWENGNQYETLEEALKSYMKFRFQPDSSERITEVYVRERGAGGERTYRIYRDCP